MKITKTYCDSRSCDQELIEEKIEASIVFTVRLQNGGTETIRSAGEFCSIRCLRHETRDLLRGLEEQNYGKYNSESINKLLETWALD